MTFRDSLTLFMTIKLNKVKHKTEQAVYDFIRSINVLTKTQTEIFRITNVYNKYYKKSILFKTTFISKK